MTPNPVQLIEPLNPNMAYLSISTLDGQIYSIFIKAISVGGRSSSKEISIIVCGREYISLIDIGLDQKYFVIQMNETFSIAKNSYMSSFQVEGFDHNNCATLSPLLSLGDSCME